MYTQFSTILVFLGVGLGMVPLMLLAGKVFRPDRPTAGKETTYECGEEAEGDSWIQFNLRFYVIAILFLIFEVEVVLMLPVATMFKHWMQASEMTALLVLVEITVFILILLVGFAYAWYKHDLEWIRPKRKS